MQRARPTTTTADLEQMISAWNQTSANTSYVQELGSTLVSLFSDLDIVLATDDNFLLSNWIGEATAWSDNSTLQAFYEVSSLVEFYVMYVESVAVRSPKPDHTLGNRQHDPLAPRQVRVEAMVRRCWPILVSRSFAVRDASN